MQIGLCVKSIDGSGGIQKDYKLWYEMFKQKGHNVYLFILETPKYESIDNNIIVLEGATIKEKGEFLEKKLKELGKFNLFLLNAEYLKQYIHQSYYITVHNTWEIPKNIFKRFKFFRKNKQRYLNENLIGISKSVLDNITDNLKIPVKSKYVIYSPHNFDKIKLLSNHKNIGEKEKQYIIAVGSLITIKNYSLLIKSFNLIKDKIKLDLFIIGEGKEKYNLKQLIKNLNLENRVKLLGFQQNPYPYIKNAKLLVSSSNSEGLPRSIVEALILHTPVVTTYSSKGIDEVMIDELQNFIVPKNQENKLANKMLEALNNYPPITDKYYSKFHIEESYHKFYSLF